MSKIKKITVYILTVAMIISTMTTLASCRSRDNDTVDNTPSTPDTPDTPDTPSDPGETPDGPGETPDTPVNPDDPTPDEPTPDDPDNPGETPDTPVNPDDPNPDEPTPDDPNNPGETPDGPVNPDDPNPGEPEPDNPNNPGETPDGPVNPSEPEPDQPEPDQPGTGGEDDCTEHDWIAASCTKPQTCRVCGKTSGTALGHKGGTATCSRRAKCDVCHASYGEFDTTSHAGGVATCTTLAVCQNCRQPYGELSDRHTGSTEVVKQGTVHYWRYTCCGSCTESEPHELVEGICSVCGYDPQLSTESKTAAQGDKSVTLAISVEDNPGILGLQIVIEYDDTNLHLVNVNAGSAMAGFDFSAPSVLESGISVLFDKVSITDADIRDGELLILTFDIDENAPAVDFQITFSVIAYDNDLNPIDFKLSSSSISVTEKA